MTGNQASRLPGAASPAGEATNAGRVGARSPERDSSPARPGQVCECGHLDVFHDLSKTRRRTACSVSSGHKATPCGCKSFTAAAEPLT